MSAYQTSYVSAFFLLKNRMMEKIMKRVLTIAGSDSLSGGGLQADLRTFEEYGVAGLNVVTCIVTVEAKTDIVEVHEVSLEMVEHQLEAVFKEEQQLDGIKIGMLASIEVAKLVAEFLKKQKNIPIVLDPVLALKESGLTTERDVIDFFKNELMPLAAVTTPNLREAELLSGIDPIDTLEKMKEAAQLIYQTGVKQVVIKGGQRIKGPVAYDLLYDGKQFRWFKHEKILNGFNNGAGCTFASAITAGLAKDYSVEKSVEKAKNFVYEAIEYGIPFLPGLGNVYQGGKSKESHSQNKSLL